MKNIFFPCFLFFSALSAMSCQPSMCRVSPSSLDAVWADIDFSDTLVCRSEGTLTERFRMYARLFPSVGDSLLRQSVGRLMHRATGDRRAYNLLMSVAEEQLYTPGSPLRSDKHYLMFLDAVIDEAFADRARLDRFEYQRDEIQKNAPGSTATDFAMVSRGGDRTSLHSLTPRSPLRLLFFYDPDCHTCSETMEALSADSVFMAAVRERRLEVLAVYPEGDVERFSESAGHVPSLWHDFYSPDGEIEELGLYSLIDFPTIYLLDSANRVVLKDVTPVQLLDYLARLR